MNLSLPQRCKHELIVDFLNNRQMMSKAKSVIVNRFAIDPQETDSIVFAALMAAISWWRPDRNSTFSSAVITAVTTQCLMFKRANMRHTYIDMEECLEPSSGLDGERIVHFRQLFNQVMEVINDVEDDEQRCILICILMYGDNYEDVSLNPPAARKMVERFRGELRDRFKGEIEWEE